MTLRLTPQLATLLERVADQTGLSMNAAITAAIVAAYGRTAL